MATRAERREYLEGLNETEWAELTQRIGDVALEKPKDRRIKLLLNAAEMPGSGDAHDRAFGLPTDAEQQLQLQRKAVATSTSSTQASWASAHAAWIAAVFAVIAVIIAIIALVYK